MAYLARRVTLEAATRRAKLDTRQYSKRQFTWARHQMKDFAWIAPDQAVEAGAWALEGFVEAGKALRPNPYDGLTSRT
jgi:tRNA A37 N6-isopentenylltransferase MiaA